MGLARRPPSGAGRSFRRQPRRRASPGRCTTLPVPRSLIVDCEPSLADPTAVAEEATSLPSSSDLKRVHKLTREPFLLEGEDVAVALAPGSPRRAAFDAALAELAQGAKIPSIEWRRTWSLLLGLERLLGTEEPLLADGTVLNAHQVDALSGTLTALLADAQRNGNGSGNGAVAELPIEPASPAIPGEEDID